MKDNLNIVIVEDNPGDRALINIRLNEIDTYNLIIEEADYFSNAVEIIKNRKVDLILLDLNLPDSNGLKTLEDMSLIAERSAIIVMTEINDKALGVKAIKLGAEDYFTKSDITVESLEKSIMHSIERNRMKRKIHKLIYLDELTGVLNRRAIYEILEKKMKKYNTTKCRHGLIFMDLSGFKQINDNLGHAVGDQLLILMSRKIIKIIEGKNVFGRIGDDEFLLFVPNIVCVEEVEEIVKNIIVEFEIPFILDYFELFLKCHFGISIYPNDGETVDQLIRNADLAMTHSKTQNSERSAYYFFEQKMLDESTYKFRLGNDLINAIEREEFFIKFQPIINIRTQAMDYSEVLIRWNHHELGMISPVDFIPIAEGTGLIIKIGEWVLRQACYELKKWMENNKNRMAITVNVSIVQLQHISFIEVVRKALKDYEIDSSCLILEVIESISVEKFGNIQEVLTKLSEMGVVLAIDDFGAGHSSLSQMKKLSVEILKIDKMFIDEIEDDNFNPSMISAIVNLAHLLNKKVVAEGIETRNQLEVIKKLGCDYGQGYYFARPVLSKDLIWNNKL